MTITDEMVQVALDTWFEHKQTKHDQYYVDFMRKALTAALSLAPETGAAASEGWVLVPARPTPAIRNALRLGSFKDVPSDNLCDTRYAAMIAAAPIVAEEGGIRICPERDGRCPHGMSCPYTQGRYRCDIDASRAAIRGTP